MADRKKQVPLSSLFSILNLQPSKLKIMKRQLKWLCLAGLSTLSNIPSLASAQVNVRMQQAFGVQGNAMGAMSADPDELQAAMRLEVDTIRRLIGLTDAATKKLDLAASAAIKNLVKNLPSKNVPKLVDNTAKNDKTAPPGTSTLSDEDSELRAESEANKATDQPFPFLGKAITIDQVKEEEIWKKSLATALSPEQAKTYESFLKERASRRRTSAVVAKADELDDNLSFTADQRKAILVLIDKKLGDELAKQPRRGGIGGGQFVVMMGGQASLELSESDLTPILSPVQLAEFKRLQNVAAQGPFGALKRVLPPGMQGQLGLNDPTQSGLGFGYVEEQQGIRIESVEPNSDADKLGLMVGDLIVEVQGIPIDTAIQLKRALNKRDSSAVSIQVQRNGKIVELSGELK